LGSVPDNISGDFDYGWSGADQRPYEHEGAIGSHQLGARQYISGLGRFVQPDPVDGGSANAFEFCAGDPYNCSDLTGDFIISAEAARRWAIAMGALDQATDYLGKTEIPYSDIPGYVVEVGNLIINPRELLEAAESAEKQAKAFRGRVRYDPYVEVYWGYWTLPLVHWHVPDPKARFATVLKVRHQPRKRRNYSRF
jgi:RHS repeat-associated protein